MLHFGQPKQKTTAFEEACPMEKGPPELILEKALIVHDRQRNRQRCGLAIFLGKRRPTGALLHRNRQRCGLAFFSRATDDCDVTPAPGFRARVRQYRQLQFNMGVGSRRQGPADKGAGQKIDSSSQIYSLSGRVRNATNTPVKTNAFF
jgi:hypothetical protein